VRETDFHDVLRHLEIEPAIDPAPVIRRRQVVHYQALERAVLLYGSAPGLRPHGGISAPSRAEEEAVRTAETEKLECTYQGVSYEPGALECWNDGYWRRCDGETGRWINLRQKCKLI